MAGKNFLILERSAQNLQKITRNGKTMLEGVFAEFGIENRNGRIYEEKEYLPHLEYLKKDITTGNLLGELDHPERFDVQLGSVSHRITELWYEPKDRQIKGRIEILEGTPKGQIAKSLLEAGIPLSISSRAAGTVNEDKTVAIQQIYTYDLVAKPGFEAAQLHNVNESANPRQAELNKMISMLNESSNSRKEHSLNSKFGVINENISILDLSDKFPQIEIRPEAIEVNKLKNNENKKMAETKPNALNEDSIQQWTLFFKKELSAINERLDQMQKSGNAVDLKEVMKYVEKIRKIQEDSLNWSSEIAKAVNEVALHSDTLAEKSNKHYKLTKKIAETVDHNAKTLNATQDWTGEVATVTNAIGETVDHNAKMLNGVNEWLGQVSKGVNQLNEWGTEKAKAINDIHDWLGENAKAVNGIHEWTSSIAKNLNHSVNWTEEMFGRAVSKEDGIRLLEYVELVTEAKSNPELKSKIDEMLRTHSITSKPLNEGSLKGIAVIDTVGKVGNVKVADFKTKDSGVEFDGKTIISKLRNIKVGKNKMPVGNDKLQMTGNATPEKVGGDGCCNDPKDLKTGLKLHKSHAVTQNGGPSGPTSKDQNLKLNVKPGGKGLVNENYHENILFIGSSRDAEGKFPDYEVKNAALMVPDDFSFPTISRGRAYDMDRIGDKVLFTNVERASEKIQMLILKIAVDSNKTVVVQAADDDNLSSALKSRLHVMYENKTEDIQVRKSNLDEKLLKIMNTIEKEKKVDESVKSSFPFTQLLSESDRKRFAGLDATDKEKVASEINKVPTTDSKVIVKLWENALATDKVDEPLWLKLAPKVYRDAYDAGTDVLKETIKAKSEYFTLNTQYQINNFWEMTSDVIKKPALTLNEAVTAKTPEESEQKLDSFVAQIGNYMKNRYNN